MQYGELAVTTMPSGETLNGVTVRIHPKSAVVRLPTNKEMLDRLSQNKSIKYNLGRRQSKIESVPNPKADLNLFNAIRLDKSGVEFDEYEAASAVGRITYNEVTDCKRDGDQYRITLKTPFGETTHVLRIPSQRDITIYRRSVVSSIDLPHNQEEVRFRTEPAVALYDAVSATFEGYAADYKIEDVPPHHKSSVVVEIVQAIDELDSVMDPNS